MGVGDSELVSISSGMYGSGYRCLEAVANVRFGRRHLRGIDLVVGITGARSDEALARGRSVRGIEVMLW